MRTLDKASNPTLQVLFLVPRGARRGVYYLCFLCSWYNLPGTQMTRCISWLAGKAPPLNLTLPSITAMIGNLMRKVGLLAICLLPDPRVFTVIFSRYSHHHGSLPALLFWARTPEHHNTQLITHQSMFWAMSVSHRVTYLTHYQKPNTLIDKEFMDLHCKLKSISKWHWYESQRSQRKSVSFY